MYFNIVFKTMVLYVYIIIAYRIMGKKEVGKLSIIDLIVSILIAELAALSIEDNSRSIYLSMVPILVLVVIQVSVSYLTLKYPKFRKVVDGNPTIIIKKGKINFNEMSKLRYSIEDLITQLREQGIKSIEEVDYAVLENNGTLSTFKKSKDYPMPIIVDGNIDFEVLKDMKKDVKWVSDILKNNNLLLDDVFYAFYTKRRTFIIKRSELL
ncbi:MAG: DUF421 domain-containing protein [Bacilli bacterium]|nr:DUF421 domain-containing protein [Bacilli bacterium]MDD4809186.1 DUF421 domain-containing protein [Bacilli bacterium]